MLLAALANLLKAGKTQALEQHNVRSHGRLTVSAEVMAWGLVWRRLSSVVRVAIISESIGRISFQFYLLLAPRDMLFSFRIFEEKTFFSNFHGFFSFSLILGARGAKISKRYSSLE